MLEGEVKLNTIQVSPEKFSARPYGIKKKTDVWSLRQRSTEP